MGSDYSSALQSLSEKAAIVASRYRIIAEQLEKALGQVETLKKELEKREEIIRTLQTEIENLIIVKTAFPSKQAIADSRNQLAGLVREIDRCITDLTS